MTDSSVRESPPRAAWRPTSAGLLTALLVGSGSLHFIVPKPYAGIVPRWLGSPYGWVYASGVAELACAAAVAWPRTRRRGAQASAALFVAVFPANIQMAVSSVGKSGWYEAAAFARLPLQAPLIWWALKVANRAEST